MTVPVSTSAGLLRAGGQASPKGFLAGTHRLIPPEETVARVQGLLPIMGITRVANVTGLDTIGIPVVMVIRPNARSLSVSQGKGGELASARASGLMEAIELFRLSGEQARHRLRVDPATVDDPGCRALLEQYARARVEVGIWEITSDVGVAAFSCTIVDSDPEPQRPIGPMGGMGCHPCRSVALSRALTEAAQSRLTIITGARDDVRHLGPQGSEEELIAARRMRDLLVAEPRTRRFQDAPDFQGGTLEEDHAFLLGQLRAVGLGEAVVVDLTQPHFGIPVVRVLVPGLEPLNDIPGYVPGARARRRHSERAP